MTEDELIAFLREQKKAADLAEQSGDAKGYHDATMAAVNAAVAVFEHMSQHAGLTGFQHGTGALLVAAKLRDVEGPCALLTADTMLYPQYTLPSAKMRTLENSPSWREWLAEKAEALLAKNQQTAPHVKEHWRRLVAQKPSEAHEGDEE